MATVLSGSVRGQRVILLRLNQKERNERVNMELKELTLKICDIFGCSSITTLPDKVMFALFS